MEDRKICGIYAIVNNKNGRLYIGQSVDIHRRFIEHKSNLNRGTHFNKWLQNSWINNGKENFSFIVLEECIQEYLSELEQAYANKFSLSNGIYNFGKFTDNAIRNTTRSEETKKKMSTAQIKNWTENRETMLNCSISKMESYPELINENGEVCESGIGIAKLSIRLNIQNKAHLSNVINGKRPSVNGWMLKEKSYYDEIEKKWKVAHKNTISHPSFVNANDGRIIESGNNMAYICKKYGLDSYHIGQVIRKERKSHKGWKLKDES